MLKISLDIDGTICDWWGAYLNKFGIPKTDTEITKNVRNKLTKDKKFWLDLPIIRYPNFIPRQYTTARLIHKTWTKEYLKNNNFPNASVYQIPGYNLSKASKLRMGKCDVHVDDSINVFIDLNLKGIPCLLINSEHNRQWGPVGRIFSLEKEEIEDSYLLFKNTLFDYFKDLVNDYRREIFKQY